MKAFLSGLVLAFVVGWVGLGPLFEKSLRQPLQFSHQAHLDLDCIACHGSVQTDSFAGLPTLDVCLLCHETPLTESPEEEKIRTLAAQGEPVQWQRLFKQPAHVYYSHRRHVAIAELKCRQCHGDIGESAAPPERVRNLTMDECMSCHQQSHVQDGCVDCHR